MRYRVKMPTCLRQARLGIILVPVLFFEGLDLLTTSSIETVLQHSEYSQKPCLGTPPNPILPLPLPLTSPVLALPPSALQ